MQKTPKIRNHKETINVYVILPKIKNVIHIKVNVELDLAYKI